MVRLTIPHYYDFGEATALVGDDLVRPEAWDQLRTGTEGSFALAADRAELERQAAERPEIAARARAIAAHLDAGGVRSVASYGVGAALLELCLVRDAPRRRLVVTDYAPRTVARVAELLPEATAVQHDLLRDGPVDAELHLFHRIDTEFTDEQWRGVLARFARARILVVATEIIDLRRVAAELRPRRRRPRTRAGWIRTRGAFESLWRRTHDATALRFEDLEGWALTPRR